MPFDPSTLCIRTTAGEAELATPAQGLSLSQRRVLTLLQDPVTVEDLAQNHRLEPEKLARDLSRLAALQLILLQGGTSTPAPLTIVPVARADAAESMAPVVIGRTPWRTPKLPLAAGAAAIVLAVGVWYGTRATESTTTALAPPAAAPSPAPPVPVPPARTGNDVARVGAVPVPVTPVAPVSGIRPIPRGNAVPPEPGPVIRPGLTVAAPSPTHSVAVPSAAEPRMQQQREATGNGPPMVPTVATPVVATAPVPASVPTSGPGTAADTPASPPVQLAIAAPAATDPRPAAATGLKAVSREAPEFPKEAIADGFRSGIVNARIHVDARGNVTGVDILGAQPPKVFDRATRRALMRWQFEPNAAGQTSDLDVDVKFQRD